MNPRRAASRASSRKSSSTSIGEIPFERAPLWVLAIAAVLLWLVCFPALVGLLQGLGFWHGERRGPAAAAALLTVGLVFGLAHRRPWNRAAAPEQRPLFVRFSGWLLGLVLYPNVLMGAVLLLRPGPPPDYAATAMIGLVLSAAQGFLAWLDRRKQRPAP